MWEKALSPCLVETSQVFFAQREVFSECIPVIPRTWLSGPRSLTSPWFEPVEIEFVHCEMG